MEEYAYVVNVDAAVVRDGRYLFVERGPEETHAPGALAFPGGKVEQPPGGEDTIEATAAREVREEVGLAVGRVEYVHSRTFAADDGTRCLNVVTYCSDVDGEARVADPGEVAAVEWLSPTALRDRPDAPGYLLEYVDRVEAVRDGDG